MSKFRFDKKAQKLRTQKSALLERLGNDAVYYFKIEVFDRKSFDGVAWKPRKDKDQSRQLMVKTGRLRNSIRVLQRGSDFVRVGTEVPYAAYHNQGTAELPQRKIIGNAKKLVRNGKKLIKQYLKG